MTKPKAYCLIRPQVHYRREAFVEGLQRAGYDLRPGSIEEPVGPDDVLVIWNRYGHYERLANMFESKGGRTIVCENGYYGKDHNDRQPYAMALTEHQGAGQWYTPPEDSLQFGERFRALGLTLLPMDFARPGYVLVCDQRGIGSELMASPSGFGERVGSEIRRELGLQVKVRPHPEKVKRAGQEPVPLHVDLGGARAVVVWSSNVSVTSLAMGIPTYFCAPSQIVGLHGNWRDLMRNAKGVWSWEADRQKRFNAMAWAQWFVDEIATGKPFELLASVPSPHQSRR